MDPRRAALADGLAPLLPIPGLLSRPLFPSPIKKSTRRSDERKRVICPLGRTEEVSSEGLGRRFGDQIRILGAKPEPKQRGGIITTSFVRRSYDLCLPARQAGGHWFEVKKAKGERVGGIPYGMRLAADGQFLEEDPGEQEVVARARNLRDQGMSLRGIGRALLEAGHTPRNGKQWHVQVLSRLVG